MNENENIDGKLMKHNIYNTFENKINYFQEIIRKTILSAYKYKRLDVIGTTELNHCINSLENLFMSLNNILIPIKQKHKLDINNITDKLQDVNNEIATLFKMIGTEDFEDLIKICFGNEYIHKNILPNYSNKYEIISKYTHPISYKVLDWKQDKKNDKKNDKPNDKQIIKKNRIVEDFMIVESSENLDCFDLARNSKKFQTKVYGIKISLHDSKQKKTMIISAITDDIMLNCLNYPYITNSIKKLHDNRPNNEPEFFSNTFNRFVSSLTLKELLVYNNEELYNRFVGYINQINLIKQKTISDVVKEFISNDLYGQRSTLIQLLLKINDPEYQYLAYLLYDLLSNDNLGNVDTQEQTLLFDSLPWDVKKFFKDAMKNTIQYTNNLSNFDNNKIPLEQQICLLKASDNVKEKAMIKLKEVKAKSEDSGSKARQYLEGLLRIPFSIYIQEPILNTLPDIKKIFNEIISEIDHSTLNLLNIPFKNEYSSIELKKYSEILKNNNAISNNAIILIKNKINMSTKQELFDFIKNINKFNKNYNIKIKLTHSNKTTDELKLTIINYVNTFNHTHPINDVTNNETINILLLELIKLFNLIKFPENNLNLESKSQENAKENAKENANLNHSKNMNSQNNCDKLNNKIKLIDSKFNDVNNYILNTSKILDNAVHGHERAKRQVERVIGQWINGEQSGYCFGFEGPPGVGKTSLAKKGIAECLKNDKGISRPFSFIAIGGSSNGSTIEGHNYTYVGSTWGRIVDILMEKKCMNPIIFIDELDKVSKTEHGKEIIGILTHLIDPTQNDTFQDKYFNGIDLDLSKALFIFSYNDVEAIDKILLDRIHRIKFEHLTLEDKITITQKYILPEIYSKMGLGDIISISEEVISNIIDEYTCEPGVRKLKEVLFEIIGEINLSMLKDNVDYELPISISYEDVKNKYLKHRDEIRIKKIHQNDTVALINGLWANTLGKGGVLPIQATFYPSNTFLDLKLTGMQGDVMKESMNVAKSLAWSLLKPEECELLIKQFEKTKLQGIHIHCPEGAVPKDGPSAGTAITIVVYSLLTNKKIKNNVAITGEICLKGNVTAIGGLELKILGGIKAGVTHFIYPKENNKEFKEFYEKYKDKSILNNVTFSQVETLEEVLPLVF
jgi:ATP-dependent Lon protease